MVGLWGEWYNSNFFELKFLLERNMMEEFDWFVNMYFLVFLKMFKVMLISGGNSLVNVVCKGVGWCVDCWGDLCMFLLMWNYMVDDYFQWFEVVQ